MQWVFDASVTLAWCFEDERTAATDLLLSNLPNRPAVVPSLWSLEVGNVLVMAVRKGRLTPERRTRFVALLEGLPIHCEPGATLQTMSPIIRLAEKHGLTTYDAAYLELALRLNLPLATLDSDLIRAAAAAGVTLL